MPIPSDPFEECAEDVVMMEEDVVGDPTLTSKKKARGGNYSVSEDEALVFAWENVSLDTVMGKDQPGMSYWQRIADYYQCQWITDNSLSQTPMDFNRRVLYSMGRLC